MFARFCFICLWLAALPAFACDAHKPSAWERDVAWNDLKTGSFRDPEKGDDEQSWFVQPNARWDGTIYESPSLQAKQRAIPDAVAVMRKSDTPEGDPIAFQSLYLEKRVVDKQPWLRVEMSDPNGDADIKGWLPVYNADKQPQVTTRYGAGC